MKSITINTNEAFGEMDRETRSEYRGLVSDLLAGYEISYEDMGDAQLVRDDSGDMTDQELNEIEDILDAAYNRAMI